MKHLDEKVGWIRVSSQFSNYRIRARYEQRDGWLLEVVSDNDTIHYTFFNIYSFIIKLLLLIGTLFAIFHY